MIHGILIINKEKGYTSHDVVAKLRGIIGQRKIGHTGTLDPDAVGVLPVCLGKGTKLCDMLTDQGKTYEAVLLLGKTTDTQDMSGTVITEYATENLTEEQVKTCIGEFVGAYAQIPPMYSALKVNGRKLYELAREGKEIERAPRNVTIFNISIKEIKLPRVRMEVSCSKGTYIRTLCHDIGQRLGVGGCMESLIRTKAGGFLLENSLTLFEVERAKKAGTLMQHIILVDAMFAEYPKISVSPAKIALAYNGNPFASEDVQEPVSLEDQELVRVYDAADIFIGIYRYEKQQNRFHNVKMFYEKDEQTQEENRCNI